MKKKIVYTDAPRGVDKALENGKRVYGLIPPPDQLEPRKDVKIAIKMSESNIDFLKEQAEKSNLNFQNLVLIVLEKYIRNQKKKLQN